MVARTKELRMRASLAPNEGLQLSWFTHLLLSYASATLLLHQLVGGPTLVEVWRVQVPAAYHLLSSVAFGTAFALDLLAVAFYARSSRLELTLLPAWIKGVPFLSSVLMATGKAVVAEATTGRLVNLQRYVCWAHTTPAVLYLIKSVANSITTQQMYSIILLHEAQLGLGAVAKLSGGITEVLLGVAVHLALVPVLLFLHTGLTELSQQYSKNIGAFVYVAILVTYGSFGVVWDLGAFGLISPAQEEAAYLLAELASKILMSTVLLFSNFVARDMRRLQLMRSIESQCKQQLIAELQQLVAQKDAFMSSVSHELRTPLNGIIGLSEAALHNSDLAQQAGAAGSPHVLPPATRQQLALIRTSGLRLLSLVNDILDTAALQHRRLVLARVRVALRPLVEEVADISRPLLRDRCLRLVTRVPHDLEVLGDPDRIVQVLNNLVSNAVKFTESGSITISARVGKQSPPSGSKPGSRPGSSSGVGLKGSSSSGALGGLRHIALVSVEDTGLGIPEDKLTVIFEAFEQVHTDLSRSQRGLGLGLNIVQQLVEAMGGTITASSVVGSGSIFTFSLPLYTPDAACEAAAAAEGAGGLLDVAAGEAVAAGAGVGAGVSVGEDACGPVSQTRLMTDRQAAMAMGSAAAGSSAAGSRGDVGASGTGDMPALAGCGSSLLDVGDSAAAAAGAGREGVCQEDHGSGSGIWAVQSPLSSAPGGRPSDVARGLLDSQEAAPGLPEPAAPLRPRSSIPATQFYSQAKGSRVQLLVVDDDMVNHQVLSLLLEAAGFSLVHVMSGAATLAYLAACELLPDVVLLDVAMPGMDGRETCRRIRSAMAGSGLHLPIVMLTAQVTAQAVDDSLAAGADDHLNKPCTREELMTAIACNYKKQQRI